MSIDSQVSNSYSFSYFLFGPLALVVIWIRRQQLPWLLFGFIVVNFHLSYETGTVSLPFEPSTIEHHQIVENLNPGTDYWKIVAIGTEGVNSESSVQKFKTDD